MYLCILIIHYRYFTIASNKLFCRDDISQNERPLFLVDKECLYYEEDKEFDSLIAKSKRKLGEDEWNKQILEITDADHLAEEIDKAKLDEYRSVFTTPIFSDSKYIYILATYHIKDSEDKRFEIEVYCPQTFEFKQSHKLILQPEVFETTPPATKAKILDETEGIRTWLSNKDKIHEVLCATNGESLAIGVNGKLYFFDLATGKRFVDV